MTTPSDVVRSNTRVIGASAVIGAPYPEPGSAFATPADPPALDVASRGVELAVTVVDFFGALARPMANPAALPMTSAMTAAAASALRTFARGARTSRPDSSLASTGPARPSSARARSRRKRSTSGRTSSSGAGIGTLQCGVHGIEPGLDVPTVGIDGLQLHLAARHALAPAAARHRAHRGLPDAPQVAGGIVHLLHHRPVVPRPRQRVGSRFATELDAVGGDERTADAGLDVRDEAVEAVLLRKRCPHRHDLHARGEPRAARSCHSTCS